MKSVWQCTKYGVVHFGAIPQKDRVEKWMLRNIVKPDSIEVLDDGSTVIAHYKDGETITWTTLYKVALQYAEALDIGEI